MALPDIITQPPTMNEYITPTTNNAFSFLTLPFEIRQIIYNYIFAGGDLMFETSYFLVPSYPIPETPILIHTPRSAAILQTCKTCLSEALDLFYQSTTYTTFGQRALETFLQILKPSNRARIAHLMNFVYSDSDIFYAFPWDTLPQLKTYTAHIPFNTRSLWTTQKSFAEASYESMMFDVQMNYTDKLINQVQTHAKETGLHVRISMDVATYKDKYISMGFYGLNYHPVIMDLTHDTVTKYLNRGPPTPHFLPNVDKYWLWPNSAQFSHDLDKLRSRCTLGEPGMQAISKTTEPHDVPDYPLRAFVFGEDVDPSEEVVVMK